MPYQDTWALCTQCGQQFVFRVEDQRRQAQHGVAIAPPAFCPACQKKTERKETPRQPSKAKAELATRPVSLDAQVLGPGPHEGVVKWFDREKGYGFIAQRSGEDIFFHRTGLALGESADIQENTPVTYCIEHTEKGPQAVDVERLDAPQE